MVFLNMVHNYLKKFNYRENLIFLFLLFSLTPVLYAAEEVNPPSFDRLFEIISKIVGLFLAASAAVLVIMIAYGIIKGSLAAGDPRGLEGARGTWTYAIYGFLVIVLSILIVTIIVSILGLPEPLGFKGFFEEIIKAISSLVDIAQSNSTP